MKGLWLLSWRHMVANPVQTVILTLCIAVPVFLPVATQVLVSRYEKDLLARAHQTPLVAGAKGNRFDLTLTALYFRQNELDPITFDQVQQINGSGLGIAIPMNIRFTARGWPIVATSPEYYELRGLRTSGGSLPLQLGDATLGAAVAEELGLATGDALFSDQRELYDISKPPALKMKVAGVLGARGTADDDVVFVDVNTAWILEGLSHGHDDPTTLSPNLILDKTDDNVRISQAMIEYNEVTPDNAHTFHYHGDVASLPLSTMLVVPRNKKGATLLKARLNASKVWQMVVPTDVIEDLLGFVFKIKRFLDAYSWVLAATTALMTALVILLSTRLRSREMETLNRIGCSRWTVFGLHTTELTMVIGLSLVLAGIGVAGVMWLVPDLTRYL